MMAAEVDDEGRAWIVDFIMRVGEVTVMRGRNIDISASSYLISRHRLLSSPGVSHHHHKSTSPTPPSV